ncbi:MAG: GAF domain-containing protein [Polyangiaceae bacterium]
MDTLGPSKGAAPQHPLVSDAVARALLRALMDAELLGIALLGGRDHVHAMLNARYQALAGDEPALGRKFADVFPLACAAPEWLEWVATPGAPGVVPRVAMAVPDGVRAEVRRTLHVTFTFLRVEGDAPYIAVLAEDVTREVEERTRAELFFELLHDLTDASAPREAVSAVIARTQRALGAVAASLFLVEPSGTELTGAPGTWDWTRSSFQLSLEEWPSVQRALGHHESVFITASGASRVETGWFEMRGIGAALCIPLAAEGRDIGVLFFDFTDAATHLDRSTLLFAEAVAGECGRALSRALRSERSGAPSIRDAQ